MKQINTARALSPPARRVLGVRVDATSYSDATDRIMAWAIAAESRVVCATGAHGVVEAQSDPALRAALDEADLNVPDGMPLVWALKHQGVKGAERVYGPDLTARVLRAAAEADVPVAFYGSTEETLAALAERLPDLAPGLRVVAMISPPFRPLTEAEREAYTARLVRSGARLVFVGLGCPRQEKWCADHKGQIPAVLLAVGAAFDFHAGALRQAPPAVQRAGLEWAFRLAMEPRRLWKRYAKVIPRFAWGYAWQVAFSGLTPRRARPA